MHLQARLLSVAVLAGLASFAMPAFAGKADSPAALRAKDLAIANGGAIKRAANDAFAVRDVIVDRDGTEHVRMDRTYRGLAVIGGDVVVHSRNGRFKSASVGLKSAERPSLRPSLSASDAELAAGTHFAGKLNDIGSQGLVIYAGGAKPVLAYEVRVRGVSSKQGEADMRYFIDAHNGKVLDSWNRIHTAAATAVGQTLFLGDINMTTNSITGGYQLVDPTRGGGNTRDGLGKVIDNVYNSAAIMTDADNNWGNNSESLVASEASDAHYGVGLTWDYYKNTFGRNGIYNDGVGVKSVVNVTFRSQGPATGGNAAWYGAPYKFMAYGLGTSSWFPVVSIDVAGQK